jgi:HlyD family secretion protein/macrolide-specific efflux system membrane fusion protein
MKRRTLWTTLLAVAGLGAALFTGTRIGRAKPPELDPALIVTAVRRPFDVEILETGRIVPREKVDIKSRLAGHVAVVHVKEGEPVKRGQVLVTLDPVDVEREVARAEAELSQARAARDFAHLVLARTERGVAQSITARNELEQAAFEDRSKAAALRIAEVARDVARDHLGYTRIVSPIDGVVVMRAIEPGEAVIPGVQSTFDGKALLTIADVRTLIVKVNLNQIDVAKVAVGRSATVTLDALVGRSFEASVTKVAPASVKLAGKEQEVFPVEAELLHNDGAIKPGMVADVHIHLAKKPEALAVPLEAIVKESGKIYVSSVTTSSKGAPSISKVEVALGLRNDREIEITSGIAPGTKVLLKPPPATDNETKL